MQIFDRKVYVVVYDPILSNGQNLSTYLGWYDHADLTQGTIDFFGQATNNRLKYRVVYTTIITDGWPELNDGFRYTEEEYLSVINGQSPPHAPDNVDYNAIVNSPTLDICGKANRGEIDEVWIYNGPYFGFYESRLVGPGAYWYNSPPVSGSHDCSRLIPIMGPSPERDLDCAIENFGHRTESTMVKVYGSWQQNRTAHNWERFALVKALSPDYSYSGCGNIHYPPNGTSDYDYGNTSAVLSNCDDFANYPNLGDPAETAQSVTCSDWGCTQIGYLAYWFGHLPSNNGCGPDEAANDWWKYFVDPALALNPSSPCPPTPTCSATPTPLISPTPTPTPTTTPPPPGSWVRQNSGTTRWLWSIRFADQWRGWASGWNGIVLGTTNGGSTWNQLCDGGPTVNDLCFVDDQYGWRVGWGYVARSTDGGVTWVEQDLGDSENLLAVHLVDRQHGWIVGGDSGLIRRTADGGASWTSVAMPSPRSWLQNVYFCDRTRGWAVGWGGNILRSTDGGVTWQRQHSGTGAVLEAVHFVDCDEGWVVGSGGTILHTTDGGSSWIPQSAGIDVGLMDVTFADHQCGWAVGNQGTILGTSDGGVTWRPEVSGVDTILQEVFPIESGGAWSAGQQGVILYRGPSEDSIGSLFVPLVLR